MDTFKDIWDSIKLAMLDRLGNPLVGAFLLSWGVWNFRVLLVLFGDGPWQEKIRFLDTLLMPRAQDWFIHGLLIPLIAALAWVFVFPFVTRLVLVFHREQQIQTARAVMVVEGEQPIPPAEATSLLARIKASKERSDQENAQLLRQNDELSQKLENLQRQLTESTRQAFSPPPTSADEESESADDSEAIEIAVAESEDQLNRSIKKILDMDGRQPWPVRFHADDLASLPSSLASKIRNHPFTPQEVAALLIMRNWDVIDTNKMAVTLGLERIDAQVAIDALQSVGLISGSATKLYVNVDGRVLTSFFKRLIAPKSSSKVQSEPAQPTNE